MLVESVRLRLLLVTPLRLALGLGFVGAARATGSGVSNKSRRGFRPTHRSRPVWLHAVHAALPSTVGVSVLAAIALAFQPTLGALLAEK